MEQQRLKDPSLVRVSEEELALLRVFRRCDRSHQHQLLWFANALLFACRQGTPDNVFFFPHKK